MTGNPCANRTSSSQIASKELRYRQRWGGVEKYLVFSINPRDPITLSDDDWGVQSPPQQVT